MHCPTLTALLLLAGSTGTLTAQTPKPVWVYGHDLRVRQGGARDFDKTTPKVGVEVYRDEGQGALVAVTQSGALAATRAGELGAEKKAPWLFAHDLGVRKADEGRFTPMTMKMGVEAFRDMPTGRLLYLSEKATAAFAPLPAQAATNRPPAWHHALTLKVRAAKEPGFSADTKKYGVEVYTDGNTGGLIYVSETGAIAAAAAPQVPPKADAIKGPVALYGLTLRCRKAAEVDFNDATQSFSVEVYRDENAGNLLYITETGAIAVVLSVETKTSQGVPWNYGYTLSARPGGVADFAKGTKFGVEVFTDSNSGNTITVSETGSIAVLPKK